MNEVINFRISNLNFEDINFRIYIHTYIYIEREREIERQTDRQRDRYENLVSPRTTLGHSPGGSLIHSMFIRVLSLLRARSYLEPGK